MTSFTPLISAADTGIISVETAHVSLVFRITAEKQLEQLYFGEKLIDAEELVQLKKKHKPDTDRQYMLEAYTASGNRFVSQPALIAHHHDGNMSTELVFVSADQVMHDDNVSETIIHLKDRFYDFFVDLHFKSYYKEDVISQWVTYMHDEPTDVDLVQFYSAYLPVHSTQYYLTHFHGFWAGEMQLTEEKLQPGTKVVESIKGVRTTQSDNPSFLLSLDGELKEDHGEVIGGAVAWTGNFRMSFELDYQNILNVLLGMNPYNSRYTLPAGKTFHTPEVILTYSIRGAGQVSRNLHAWARKYNLYHGDDVRPVVLNSWEGAYFSFDEAVLEQMMTDAAEIGVEMFVLDDGWFGNKYPRNNDNAGLGDWQVNREKLLRGINHLADFANARGMQFGLWIEPEMVNPKSELFEQHPEWVVQQPNRELYLWRNQLLLDLTNPAVQDFIYNTVDSILTAVPNIAYLKWDANRHVENAGSTYLDPQKQTHFWIEYTKGLYDVYERIRSKYPGILIQACASGGGRLDFGSLKYHDEFWPSDNTDPLKRIRIQYATNLIYPPIATASHVSTSPNHQTNQVTPLKFRFDVAMTGRLGLELQPKDLDSEEKTFAASAISDYKKIRETIQHGDLHRLYSPYDEHGWSGQMCLSPDQSEAVVFIFSLTHHNRGDLPVIKLKGLDPGASYNVTELNKNNESFWGNNREFTGDYLMKTGMNVNVSNRYESAVFRLTLSGKVK